MATHWKYVLIGTAALGLTACAETSSRFNSEAGAFLDEGGFGNPTMHNMLAQMCKGRAKGYVPEDPVVVLDPKSTPGKPRYYRGSVSCSGDLNGKYAEVIFEEYLTSAAPELVVEQVAVEGE